MAALRFQIDLEFRNVGFGEEGKTGEPGEKTLGARTRTNNKLNPHITPSPGFEPGPHWWEASDLTTTSSLLPANVLIHHVFPVKTKLADQFSYFLFGIFILK